MTFQYASNCIQSGGDGFAVAFGRAADGLAAARSQTALAGEIKAVHVIRVAVAIVINAVVRNLTGRRRR